jgi:hypothetical protein
MRKCSTLSEKGTCDMAIAARIIPISAIVQPGGLHGIGAPNPHGIDRATWPGHIERPGAAHHHPADVGLLVFQRPVGAPMGGVGRKAIGQNASLAVVTTWGFSGRAALFKL